MSEANYPEIQHHTTVFDYVKYAQTFIPRETHELEFVTLKLEHTLALYYVDVALQYTTPAGLPTGSDLTVASMYSTHVMDITIPLIQTFRFKPFHIVAGIPYALVIRLRPVFIGGSCELYYELPPGHYPRGKLLRKYDWNPTWDPTDQGDLFFAEWGDPPLPPSPPPPPTYKFAVLDLAYCHWEDGVLIRLPTNTPCHLTCFYTDKQPLKHHTTRIVRGLSVPWNTYFCFVAWNSVEQLEYGSTLWHTFLISPWSASQTKWFSFRGEVDLLDVPSASPIFKHHHPGGLPLTQFQNTDYYSYIALGLHNKRIGQRVDSLTSTVFSVSWFLWRRPTAVGPVYCRIRRVSDDSIIATSFDIIEASTITTGYPQWYTFTFFCAEIDSQDVRISLENIGSRIRVCYSIVNHIPGVFCYFTTFWRERPPYDTCIKLN